MAKRSVLARALGLHKHEPLYEGDEVYGPTWPAVSDAERPRSAPGAEEPASELGAIFASIRTGQSPWNRDHLPSDTGAVHVLLCELDRLWQNPEA